MMNGEGHLIDSIIWSEVVDSSTIVQLRPQQEEIMNLMVCLVLLLLFRNASLLPRERVKKQVVEEVVDIKDRENRILIRGGTIRETGCHLKRKKRRKKLIPT